MSLDEEQTVALKESLRVATNELNRVRRTLRGAKTRQKEAERAERVDAAHKESLKIIEHQARIKALEADCESMLETLLGSWV